MCLGETMSIDGRGSSGYDHTLQVLKVLTSCSAPVHEETLAWFRVAHEASRQCTSGNVTSRCGKTRDWRKPAPTPFLNLIILPVPPCARMLRAPQHCVVSARIVCQNHPTYCPRAKSLLALWTTFSPNDKAGAPVWSLR